MPSPPPFRFALRTDIRGLTVGGVGGRPSCLQNRELEIMRMVDHRNIVVLKWFFLSPGQKVR